MTSQHQAYRPKARFTGLVLEEEGDEVLVYDCETHNAHLLAGPTAKIWRLCDGDRRNMDMVKALDGPDASLIVVDGALAELEAIDLLERAEDGQVRQTAENMSRRAFLTNAAGTSAFVGATIATAEVAHARNLISTPCGNGQARFDPCQNACPTAIRVGVGCDFTSAETQLPRNQRDFRCRSMTAGGTRFCQLRPGRLENPCGCVP